MYSRQNWILRGAVELKLVSNQTAGPTQNNMFFLEEIEIYKTRSSFEENQNVEEPCIHDGACFSLTFVCRIALGGRECTLPGVLGSCHEHSSNENAAISQQLAEFNTETYTASSFFAGYSRIELFFFHPIDFY